MIVFRIGVAHPLLSLSGKMYKWEARLFQKGGRPHPAEWPLSLKGPLHQEGKNHPPSLRSVRYFFPLALDP
jgi:hypothetical protein